MNRKKYSKRLITVFVVLVLAFTLAACGKKATLIGTWTVTNNGGTDEYIFNEDGTGSYTPSALLPINYSYTTEAETLTITMKILGQDKVDSYNYKLDGDKLTMSVDSKDVIYERK